jgi:hypothetical protein
MVNPTTLLEAWQGFVANFSDNPKIISRFPIPPPISGKPLCIFAGNYPCRGYLGFYYFQYLINNELEKPI